MSTRPAKTLLADMGITLAGKSACGRRELVKDGASLGWFTAIEASRRFLPEHLGDAA